MHVDLPDSMVLCIAGCANPEGPGIEIMVQAEWWAAQPKLKRKAMFEAILKSLEQLGAKVIGEEPGDVLPELAPRPN